jgi:hypothetical protein
MLSAENKHRLIDKLSLNECLFMISFRDNKAVKATMPMLGFGINVKNGNSNIKTFIPLFSVLCVKGIMDKIKMRYWGYIKDVIIKGIELENND